MENDHRPYDKTHKANSPYLSASGKARTYINTLTPSNVSVNMRASSNSCTAVGEFIR